MTVAPTRRESIASFALGIFLAFPLLHLLPAAFGEPSRRRSHLALLLCGLLCCFMLEKCGVQRRFTLDDPAERSHAGPWTLHALRGLALCGDAFLVAVILSTQPAASALAMLLPSVDAPQCRAAFVLASSRLLYIGVGELVPCLRGAPQARPLRQMVLIALGVLLCAVMPAMGAI